MQIDTAVGYFNRLRGIQGQETPAQFFAEMDQVIRAIRFPSGAPGHVEDYLNDERDAARNIVPYRGRKIGVVLEYPAGANTNIGMVYEDLYNPEIGEFVDRFGLRCSPPPSYAVQMDPESRLMFPITAWFSHKKYLPEKDRVEQQRNILSFNAYCEPTEDLLGSGRKACEDCDVKVFTSTQSRDGRWGRRTEVGYASTLAPEFELVATWQGEDFDKKAMQLYRKLREVFLAAHREAALKYAHVVFDNSFDMSNPGGFTLNQEWGGPLLSDMRCHISCDIPFVHEEEMVAHLAYYNFYGR
ncbi:MAG TPA: hypothetical protein VJB05_02770 [archaeon]|nr:hypothetical protein [archaeon]